MEILLKKWALTDAEALSHVANEVDRAFLSNRLPDPYTVEDAKWYVNMASEHDGIDCVFRAVVVDGKVVGTVSVEGKDDVYCKDAEIGYYLDQAYWSKGVMTEAVRQICTLAFEQLNIVRITGLIYETNLASRKVLEKNGFELEGVKRNAVYKNGRIQNLVIMGKLMASQGAHPKLKVARGPKKNAGIE